MRKKIICIVGATASGKTALSIELAKQINAEIISADSMQIYKKLNIGTAKVTKEEMEGISHHMIDICDVREKFSVADFKNMCYDKISEISKRNKNVIIVGGTGLYFNSVIYDMNFDNQKNTDDYRDELQKILNEKGKEYLYNKLVEIDPISAKEIHPNNIKRVIRALEIAKNSEKLKSEHMMEEIKRLEKFSHPDYEFFVYYIDYPREKLYERINKRIDIMVKNGVLDEAKMLYGMNLDKDNTCIQAIGYKEFFEYFEGKENLDDAIEKLKKSTRHYAKRQITWFKNKLNCHYLEEYNNVSGMVNEIISDSKILEK